MKSENDDESALASLTEKQRAVLDLLVQHQTSKEIARNLGISPYTVDQRIAAARRKFGVGSRGTLAAAYQESLSIYERSVYQGSYMGSEATAVHSNDRSDEVRATPTGRQIMVKPDWRLEALPQHRVVPEMFEGQYGALFRIAAILVIALLLLIVTLGGVAAFGQLSDVLA